jgi:hypothetical protein
LIGARPIDCWPREFTAMSNPQYTWSADIESRIVSAIRNGAFPTVAAEANGIPRKVFARWLRLGDRTRAKPRWREFRDKVRAAVAYARLKAETESLRDDARSWLKYGPGRETADAPGWSNAVKPSAEDPSKSPSEGHLPLDLFFEFIPELNNLPLEFREILIKLMNQGIERRARCAS